MTANKSNNIEKIMDLLKIFPEELSKEVNCSKSHIYTLQNRKKPLGELWKIKLAKFFLCDEKYLEMQNFNENEFIQNTSYKEIINIKNNQQTNLIPIKYFPDIEASAGSNLDVFNDGDVIIKEIDSDLLQFFTASQKLPNHNKISLIKINGDSMEPILENENWVVVDHNQRTPSESRQIFIIQNNKNQIFIKYIRCKMNGKFDIISANKEYESMMDIDLNAPEIKQFTIIGRVIACIKDM